MKRLIVLLAIIALVGCIEPPVEATPTPFPTPSAAATSTPTPLPSMLPDDDGFDSTVLGEVISRGDFEITIEELGW